MPGFDLHFHSTYSDGELSIAELAKIIKDKKFKYCALADHNTVAGVAGLIVELSNTGIKVIPAAELTAKYNDNEVHILAYDFDIKSVAEILKIRNEIVREKKIAEMSAAVELSIKEGFKISDNLEPEEKLPATLLIAVNICENLENQKIFKAKHGKYFKPEDFYYEYQAPGKACAVERSGVTVQWLVQNLKPMVKDLVIAHPFVSVSVVTKPLSKPDIIDLLNIGLTGVELYHNKTSSEQIDLLKEIIRERSIHFTGGSDFHGHENDTPIGQYGPNEIIPNIHLLNFK